MKAKTIKYEFSVAVPGIAIEMSREECQTLLKSFEPLRRWECVLNKDLPEAFSELHDAIKEGLLKS